MRHTITTRILSFFILILVIIIVLLVKNTYAASMFVATSGNDANDCLSLNTACETLPVALTKADPDATTSSWNPLVGLGIGITILGSILAYFISHFSGSVNQDEEKGCFNLVFWVIVLIPFSYIVYSLGGIFGAVVVALVALVAIFNSYWDYYRATHPE